MIEYICDKCGKKSRVPFIFVRPNLAMGARDLCATCAIKYNELWKQLQVNVDEKLNAWLGGKDDKKSNDN